MPAPYGFTVEGFSRPTVEELRAKINARIWGRLGPNIDLSDRSYEGFLVGIMCDEFVSLWEVGEDAATTTLDPDAAVDAALDVICALTGTLRPGASASTVVLTLTGDDTTVVPITSGGRVPNGVRFETLGPATLAALTARAPSTAYAVGDRRTNGGNAYVCITSGVSSAGAGPTTDAPDIVDGTAHWRFMGEGVATQDVDAKASATGPLVAYSGTITEIATPVGGWRGVINLGDATPGANQMSNEALRVLRQIELARPGSGSVDALEADLIEIAGVTAVTVFNNNTDLTVDGMPPHSIEAMVSGGEDQAIWTLLHQEVGGGIATHGTEVGTVADRRGRLHTYRFSRPETLPIYVALTVVYDAASAPADLADQIKAAVVAWGNTQDNGRNAVATRIAATAYIDDAIVFDVAALISIAPGPSDDATIEVGIRQKASYDTSRVAVTLVPGEA